MSKPTHISEPIKEAMKQIKEKTQMKNTKTTVQQSPYISPNELAERWACSRSSVDRIARRNGLTRLCIGEGKNGSIRYLTKEVIAYEKVRLVTTK